MILKGIVRVYGFLCIDARGSGELRGFCLVWLAVGRAWVWRSENLEARSTFLLIITKSCYCWHVHYEESRHSLEYEIAMLAHYSRSLKFGQKTEDRNNWLDISLNLFDSSEKGYNDQPIYLNGDQKLGKRQFWPERRRRIRRPIKIAIVHP